MERNEVNGCRSGQRSLGGCGAATATPEERVFSSHKCCYTVSSPFFFAERLASKKRKEGEDELREKKRISSSPVAFFSRQPAAASLLRKSLRGERVPFPFLLLPSLLFSLSPGLEQQHCVVSQVEVDKVLGLVRDVGSWCAGKKRGGFLRVKERKNKSERFIFFLSRPFFSPPSFSLSSVPKFLPTTQCHSGECLLSNSFLMYAAMSFSIVYLSMAWYSRRRRAGGGGRLGLRAREKRRIFFQSDSSRVEKSSSEWFGLAVFSALESGFLRVQNTVISAAVPSHPRDNAFDEREAPRRARRRQKDESGEDDIDVVGVADVFFRATEVLFHQRLPSSRSRWRPAGGPRPCRRP